MLQVLFWLSCNNSNGNILGLWKKRFLPAQWGKNHHWKWPALGSLLVLLTVKVQTQSLISASTCAVSKGLFPTVSPDHAGDRHSPTPCFFLDQSGIFSKTWIIPSLDLELTQRFAYNILPFSYFALSYSVLWWHTIDCYSILKEWFICKWMYRSRRHSIKTLLISSFGVVWTFLLF